MSASLVGSEMCIRDRTPRLPPPPNRPGPIRLLGPAFVCLFLLLVSPSPPSGSGREDPLSRAHFAPRAT
eukprot:441995-Alexandrium_andersonii.AAC.1